jgi:hypothetical protein
VPQKRSLGVGGGGGGGGGGVAEVLAGCLSCVAE